MSAENQNMACMQLQDEDNEVVVGNQLRRMWYSFCKRKVAVLGLVIVLIYIIVAIFAPLLAPYDPVKQDLANMLQTPGPKHLLGTDEMGRDILSRIIYGARISMKVGFYAVGVAFVIGIPLGIFAGYFGGKVDLLIMRAMDVLLAFPGILLSIVFVSVLGPNLDNAILSVGIYTVPNFARMARGETLALRNSEFIEAGQSHGLRGYPHRIFPYPHQYRLAHDRHGNFELRHGHYHHLGHGLSGDRCPAAHAGMGRHALQRPPVPAGSPPRDHVHRPGHPVSGAGLKPSGRRPADVLDPKMKD